LIFETLSFFFKQTFYFYHTLFLFLSLFLRILKISKKSKKQSYSVYLWRKILEEITK
jgi:hypothetical protein